MLYCKVLLGSNLKVRSMDCIEFVHVGLIYINRLALYIFMVFLKIRGLNTFINVLAVILSSRYELEPISTNVG